MYADSSRAGLKSRSNHTFEMSDFRVVVVPLYIFDCTTSKNIWIGLTLNRENKPPEFSKPKDFNFDGRGDDFYSTLPITTRFIFSRNVWAYMYLMQRLGAAHDPFGRK